MLDDKGRLFGKINIIDFFVFLFLLCLMAVFPFAYKIMTRKPEPPSYQTTYQIARSCPVCGNSILIDTIEDEFKRIPKGKPLPKYYETICLRCENKVVLIDTKPPLPPPESPNWESMFFKWLYENREFLLGN